MCVLLSPFSGKKRRWGPSLIMQTADRLAILGFGKVSGIAKFILFERHTTTTN
jgi:hypothetical protein